MGKNLVAINKAEHEIPIQTIKSHFEKERQLFKRGIKCLSLFFIDEVAKYKRYDEDGNEEKGIFQELFEEEYAWLINDEFHL